MGRIDKLTPLQEKQLIDFKQECLEIGLSTDRINRAKNQETVNWIYKKYLNIKEEPYIWYVDSPLMYNLIINILFNLTQDINFRKNLGDNLQDNFWTNLENNLQYNFEGNLRANFWINLSANLRANFWTNLLNNLSVNLRGNFWENLGDNLQVNLKDNLQVNLSANLSANFRVNLLDNLSVNLWKNLRGNLGDNFGDNLKDNLRGNLKIFHNIYWSNIDIYWLSFYIFPQRYMNIDYGKSFNEDLIKLFEFQKNIGYVFYHKNICFISEKPIEINKKGIQLHADKKPSVLFADGYCLWTLNGVKVPRNIVESDPEDIDVNLIFKEKNVEVRREILRKIGINRVIRENKSKILDRTDDNIYELLEIDLKLTRPVHYLKMINPSIDTFHLEGVPYECDTIEKALAWRDSEWDVGEEFKGYVAPEVLT